MEGKRWQGIMMEEWEKGILEGSTPYWVLLGGENPHEILPRYVVDFMKKELFKGTNKDIIENTYRKVLKHWTWWRRLLYKFRLIYY